MHCPVTGNLQANDGDWVGYQVNGWRVFPNMHPESMPSDDAYEHRRQRVGPNLFDNAALPREIMAALNRGPCQDPAFPPQSLDVRHSSAVLFLLGELDRSDGRAPEPCLILNKRSLQVRQPGDLCCPGGGIAPGKDALLAGLLKLPGSPLKRWPHWRSWRRECSAQAFRMARLLATGLREAFEEMRLNPLRVQFLGPLRPQPLRMFRRIIYPMAVWVPHQQRFTPNWEVAAVVRIPLRLLLQRSRYARYRLQPDTSGTEINDGPQMDYRCFETPSNPVSERLWGATFRITIDFLKRVWDFDPPPRRSLPLVHGSLDATYRTGRRHP
jgi:8-oxo-dGTP pyrophosphatase MutT (NUDIX family)